MSDVMIRPMQREDVAAVERLTAHAFREVDRADLRPGDPTPELRSEVRAATWRQRAEHLLATDPGGCWVCEDDQGVLAAAVSFVRETTWILATYAVRPGEQGRGVGKPLLEAAMGHGRHCLHGMLGATGDPRAVRRYRAAGFDLHPKMTFRGVVDRSALPVLEKVREASPADVELMDSVDRRTRGAGHGPDHEFLLAHCATLVSDTTTGAGYVHVDPARGPQLLAATNRRTATRLLWASMALCEATELSIDYVTGANQWVFDVALPAGLTPTSRGYLALRGLREPTPYLPHSSLL
ncbi:GNAT family N-acetyltransferase [Nocardioides panacisoli]|uniref:GNAT family N-acetyltransferase n=1 Tax=Nocardioides panacisoli TaxID=627624 RepID=UPI001C62CF4D|nr:GNAT family N-acetyltransferase [Nocardioides panacisoli]QYJ05536.1 GNAT family N-acetyltransferase [Nocardioides panacisoli]